MAVRDRGGPDRRRAGERGGLGASLRLGGGGAAARLRPGGGRCTSLARAFGGRGGFLGARAALFWSGLAVGAGGAGDRRHRRRRRGADRAGAAVARLARLCRRSALWVWIFAASLAEAEGFASTGRVAAVVVARPRRRSRRWSSSPPATAFAEGRAHVGAARHRQPAEAARGGAADPRRAAAGGEPWSRRRCSSPAPAWSSATWRCCMSPGAVDAVTAAILRQPAARGAGAARGARRRGGGADRADRAALRRQRRAVRARWRWWSG